MGSFYGHVIPGSLFLLVGLWHLIACIFAFVSNPREFKGRIWHRVPGFHGRLRYLELYIIILGCFLDMCIEFFYATRLKFVENGGLNSKHLNDFEHTAMLLMFFIYGVCAYVSEATRFLPLPQGSLHIIAGMAFMAEYLLFYFHSTSHAGLEGRYHVLLVILIGLCIVLAVLGAVFPKSFTVDLASSLFVMMQGAWFYQTAYALYGPLMPNGCHEGKTGIVCESLEFELRGLTFANLQLSILVFVVSILVTLIYGVAAHVSGHPDLSYIASGFEEENLYKAEPSLS
ncbi:hypothetical protein O6H91_02G078300 [Diphasiastrum complanatum]|uniref:Uncharacterized protein n=1 Tax=Diphasiastrum complanatum TaxID=34168 RepID=A0ACC2EHI4_DIPCM|nr:hypothetical protein O6H91_02G078300 [Diphasiastrum complanatum]